MIYTFYSYKGGVGRSMALVNIAELMYRAGLKVLMVDWDLEAPGLERFFPDSMKQVLNTPGVIEMLLAYKEKALQFSPESGKSLFPVDQIESYIVDIDIDTTSSAKLSLLPAGYRAEGQFAEYVNRIKTFDWQDFYQNWEGEIYFEWLREQLENLADVVLIDSRTGVTEMGGVCTYQLADVVVLLCAANEQNIDGTLQMVKSFSDPRLPELRNGRKLKTLVVPARIEKYELTILNKFRQKFFECFAPYMPSELQPDEPQSKRDFFLQFEIPYIPLYAFEEIIAVSQTGDKRSIEMEQAYDELCQALYHLAPNDSVIKQRLLGSTSTEFVGGEPMTRRYNLKKIRILLTEGFTNEELRRLCHDVRDFRVVYDQLAEYSGKAEIIDRLLEHTEQKRLIEILLTRAKEHNPIRYEKHQPYHESTIASPTFQEVWKIQTLRKPKHLFAGPDYLCLVTKEALHFLSPNDGASVLSPLIRVKDLLLADNAPVGGVVTPSGNLLLTLLPPNLSGKASLWSLKLIGPSTGQPKEVLCQRIYEAPSAQLSAPVIDNETVYLIQRGPELVILDPVHGQEQRTLPLPKLDNLHRDCVSFVFAADRLCLGLCNGAILALDPQTGQTLMPLREPDGSMLS
ncbi:MAG: AAA family ATPase, partial [Chloroflexi bacterium]|nr:AAA family ATPase [Chloroflexota bacterium]